MSELLLCHQPIKANFLTNTCGIDPHLIYGKGGSKPASTSAYTPYVLGQEFRAFDSQLISTLAAPKVAKTLTQLSLSFGRDTTVALAEITQKLQEYNLGLIGDSTQRLCS